MSKVRHRLAALGLLLVVIAAVRVGQELYRWQAFRAERAEILHLQAELESAAVGVVETETRAASLQREIETADGELDGARSSLDAVERGAAGRGFDRRQEMNYRTELAAFNGKLAQRNELVRQWRETLDNNHRHVDRFNLLADSIRGIALRMGEAYYPIPPPAELAARRELQDEVAGHRADPRATPP